MGPIPKEYTVNHDDLNKFNNDVKNLKIMTKSDNLKHAWRNGVYDKIKLPKEFQ
ncbi:MULTISPECIES: HNH endonuclease [Bacillaceae]|uniref:HNH endonuclease n=1 Tax=Bacillaceae TaxID=186817 RepID=UPI000C764AA2|nr:hypothetical protein CYJ36_13510 [Bacillus sp. UMB0893]